MSAALPYLKGEQTGRIVVLTFDDGYRDTLELALPELTAHGFTATCYMVSHGIGRENDWDPPVEGVRKPLMNQEQVRSWLGAGMEVGAHTRTHPWLTRSTPQALWEEVAGCKQDLETTVGHAVPHFCYPYGNCDRRVADAVRQAGFTTGVTTHRARATPGDDLHLLPRVTVKGYYGLTHFLWRLMDI